MVFVLSRHQINAPVLLLFPVDPPIFLVLQAVRGFCVTRPALHK